MTITIVEIVTFRVFSYCLVVTLELIVRSITEFLQIGRSNSERGRGCMSERLSVCVFFLVLGSGLSRSWLVDHGFMQSTPSVAFRKVIRKLSHSSHQSRDSPRSLLEAGSMVCRPPGHFSRVILPSAVLSGPDGGWRWC